MMQGTCRATSDSQSRLDLLASLPERHCRDVSHLAYLHLAQELVAVLRPKVNDRARKSSRVLAERNAILLHQRVDAERLPLGPLAQVESVGYQGDIVGAVQHRHLE